MTDTAQTGVTGELPPQDQGAPQSAPDATATTATPNTGVSVPPTETNIPSGVIPDSVQPTPRTATTGQLTQVPPQGAPQATNTPPPVKGVSPNDPNAGHPAVQAAGRVNSILNAILPPRVNTRIDVNTGETIKTPVPRTRGDIAMAIALEAISGGLAGLQGKGPNRYGQAAAAGLAQGQEIEAKRKAEDQQQAQEASADYARHANILETNMKMWANAHAIGQQDLANNQAYVAAYKPLLDTLQKYPGVIKTVIPESRFSEFHVTKDNAIPYAEVPRPDPSQPDGQAVDKYGNKQWDLTYAIVDPNFKASDLLSDKEKKQYADLGMQGFINGNGDHVKWPQNIELMLNQALNFKATAAALEGSVSQFKDIVDTINNYGQGRRGGYTFSNTKAPDLPTQDYDHFIHDAALKYGQDENLIKGIIKQESNGNPGAVNQKSGATGLMQLMPKTANDLGVTDSFNPQQNIEGGVKYLSQMMARYQGNARLALAAYDAGPERVTDHVPPIPETQQYVNAILGSTGIGDQTGVAVKGSEGLLQGIDLKQAIKDDPTLPNALTSMRRNVGGKDNINADWDNFRAKDFDSYNKVINLLPNGAGTIRQYADAVAQQTQLRKDADAEAKQSTEQQNKLDFTQKQQATVRKILEGPNNYVPPANVNDMSTNDLRDYMEKNGVGVGEDGKVPDTFDYLNKVARLELPLGSTPVRIWALGSPKELDQQEVGEYVSRFLNNKYSAQAYKNWTEAHDANTGIGQTIQNAGVAVNHGELLRQSLVEMKNGNVHALTRIGNEFQLNLEGKAAPAQFQAIANAYAREVSKVAAGQASPYAAEVEQSHDALDRDLSQTALEGVINSSNKLMHGRIHTIDQNTYKQTGRHLDNVDDAATASFQKLGAETPWTWSSLPKPPQAGAVMDKATAQQYAIATGGNLAKARQLAKQYGWNTGGQQAPPQQQPQQRPQVAPQRPQVAPQQRPQTNPSPIAPPGQDNGIVNDNDEAESAPQGLINTPY
jgi:hypothetical protein